MLVRLGHIKIKLKIVKKILEKCSLKRSRWDTYTRGGYTQGTRKYR